MQQVYEQLANYKIAENARCEGNFKDQTNPNSIENTGLNNSVQYQKCFGKFVDKSLSDKEFILV